MKKFVSMETINKVFDDLSQVDYITVQSITDSSVLLLIHLKISKRINPGDALDRIFQERMFVLSNMLDRTVTANFIYASFIKSLGYKFQNSLHKS